MSEENRLRGTIMKPKNGQSNISKTTSKDVPKEVSDDVTDVESLSFDQEYFEWWRERWPFDAII
jgi:hypothetical protein